MACRFEITLDGRDARHLPAARRGLDEADRLEAELTIFRDTSEISRVNRLAGREPVCVDPALFVAVSIPLMAFAPTPGSLLPSKADPATRVQHV